jgi:kynureninase
MDRSRSQSLDQQDPLKEFKKRFVITDPGTCYLDGNSLGRLPHTTVKALNDFLHDEWGREVVVGWSHWIDEAQHSGNLIGRSALGAAPGQVLACDTTSVNIYQLASAAIKARPGRGKIITDAANFPTDRYILQGLAKEHELELIVIDNEDPKIAVNEVITEELLARYLDEDVALVSLQVIQYRSGARQNVRALTELIHKFGALVLWDAAHAVGSIEMSFDKDKVNLAVGCTYKYGNSGPGAPAWLYVNRSLQNELQPSIQGWFAQRDQFAMGPTFEKDLSIRGFQIASPSILGLRCINSSFAMIEEAGIAAIEAKAAMGTELMIELHDEWLAPLGFTLITPREASQRGGHITISHPHAEQISIALRKYANTVADYRTPNSIRLAISPLATSYCEVFDGFARMRDLVANRQYEKVATGDSRVT